jgi:hypothetical protein
LNWLSCHEFTGVGEKVKLVNLFRSTRKFTTLPSPVHDQKNVLQAVPVMSMLLQQGIRKAL